MAMPKKISVIGAGSWGTALSKLLGEKGNNVLVWAHEPNVAEGINGEHKNPLYLSDVRLPLEVRATSVIEEAIEGRDIVVSAVPSRYLREVWEEGARYLAGSAILVSCTKGIEKKTLKLMNQVLTDCLPDHPVSRRTVLSGPSFAHEVAAGLPTSVVIAGTYKPVCREIQSLFRTNMFLTFTHDDVVGVEVGGAIKNVIAIAAGISDGLRLGHNSRASIITRGLYEMIKFGKALGANPLTFTGLSGIGDLVLTSTADLSRNHTVGRAIGEGQKLDRILGGMKMVAEGVTTAKAVHKIAINRRINAPICDVVHQILFKNLSPKRALSRLCQMSLKEELSAIY